MVSFCRYALYSLFALLLMMVNQRDFCMLLLCPPFYFIRISFRVATCCDPACKRYRYTAGQLLRAGPPTEESHHE